MNPVTAHLYSQSTQPATQCSQQGPPPAAQQPTRWGYLFSHKDGANHSLSAALITIGRSENCSVMIPDEKISGVHCVITREAAPGTVSPRETPFFNPNDSMSVVMGDGRAASSSVSQSLAGSPSGAHNTSRFQYFIEDRSMNGTFLNGRRLTKGVKEPIQNNTELSFVAISSKRSRTSQTTSEKSDLPPKIISYASSFGFYICKEQPMRVPTSLYHSADASTVAGTPASMAFTNYGQHPLSAAASSVGAFPPSTVIPASPPALVDRPKDGGVFPSSAPGSSGPQPLGIGPSTVTMAPMSLARQMSKPRVLSWQWGEVVGTGSFAEVYLGIDTETARLIAIKRLRQSIFGGAGASIEELNAGDSDTLRDWEIDPDDVFDAFTGLSKNCKKKASGTKRITAPAPDSFDDDGSRVLTRHDSSNDNITTTSNTKSRRNAADDNSIPSSVGSPRVVPSNGCSPTDPTTSTIPMVSKAVLRRDYSTREEFQGLSEEQHAEVELLKSLNHPSVVHYYGFAIEDDHLCILLEFVAGGSLVSLLKKFGAFQESVVRIYTTQALQGLEYLHENGVVHGDIKPGNFLVTDKGRVKLSDFGTGRIVSSAKKAKSCGNGSTPMERADSDSPSATLTGTPAFMSPDMIRSNKSTFSSDVWALGCTVLELITGKAPWRELGEMNAHALVFQIGTRQSAPSIALAREKGGSEVLINFLQWCFTVNPDERPSATDLLSHPFIAPDSTVPYTAWRPASTAGMCNPLQSLMASQQAGAGYSQLGGSASTGGSAPSVVDVGGLVSTPPRSAYGENSNNAVPVPPALSFLPPMPPYPSIHATAAATNLLMSNPNSQQQSQQQPASQQAVPPPPPPPTAEQLRRQQTVAGEVICKHQQYLHSLAKSALKRMPSSAGHGSSSKATPKDAPTPPSLTSPLSGPMAAAPPVPGAPPMTNHTASITNSLGATPHRLASDAHSSPSTHASAKEKDAPPQTVAPTFVAKPPSSVSISTPFPAMPANLFMPHATMDEDDEDDANMLMSGQFPVVDVAAEEEGGDDTDVQRQSEAATMGAARTRDHEEASTGRHSGLTTKLRRIEL